MEVLALFVLCLLCPTSHSIQNLTPQLTHSEGRSYEGRSLSFFYNQQYRSRDLWDAIEVEDVDLFFIILECECVNLEETNESGETALLIAVRTMNLVMSRALVEAGANVNVRDSIIGNSALHISCFHHLMNITRVLLAAGADVNRRSFANERPIIMAQTLDDLPLLRLLIRSGAEINFQDDQGESPLHEAAAYGAVRNAEFLIERGAELDVREQEGLTPAEFICACQDFDEREAAACFDGTCTPNDIAALERVFRQAERRESVTNSDRTSIEDLWFAIVNGSIREIRAILSRDSIELQAVTQSETEYWVEGQTALHLAVLAGREDACGALLDAGARPDVGNAVGNTPLHLATMNNSVNIVELLLDQDVDIDEQNDEGQTALHIASIFGFIEIVELLVRNGAMITVHDEQGATPIEILCSCILDENCPEDSCRDSTDIVELMSVLDQDNEERQQQLVNLYFPNSAVLAGDEVDELPDDDDGASSLGAFIGVLFACAFVFFVIYGISIIYVRRRNARARLNQRLNQPGPSTGPPLH